MSASMVLDVERAAQHIQRFHSNTLKSKGRLNKEESVQLRIELLESRRQEFEAAWKVWQKAADAVMLEADEDKADEYHFKIEYYEDIEEAHEEARHALLEIRSSLRATVSQAIGAAGSSILPPAHGSLSTHPLGGAAAGTDSSMASNGLPGVAADVVSNMASSASSGMTPSAASSAASGMASGMAPGVASSSAAPGNVVVVDQQYMGLQSTLRLPPIQPPTFSGELDEWVSFRDVFSALVNNNNQLSDIHRLHMLRAACIGQAADAIAGIALMNGNFETAWQTLFRLIERMLKLPAMSKECSVELARLINGTNQCVRSLRVLQRHTDHLDDVLVVLTVTKLDVVTRMEWERAQGANKVMPTFAQLDDFLHGVLGSLEAMRDVSVSIGGASSARHSHPSNQSRRSAHSHVVATSTNGRDCVLCQGQHGLYKCPQFMARSVAERRAFAGEQRLCFRCLATDKHRAQTCNARFSCRTCGLSHHSLLHIEPQTAQAAQGSAAVATNPVSSSSSAAAGGRPTPFHGQSRASTNTCTVSAPLDPRETLLPTAMIMVTTPQGRTSRLRALVDQGSQVSIISRQAVQRLGLRWQASDIQLTGVAKAAAGRNYGCVKFRASSCTNGKGELDVCALVLSSVTADLPSATMVKSSHPSLAKLQLADEKYWQTGRIDLLLGAAAVADMLMHGVLKVDGLVAQETMFGWMVSGTTTSLPAVSASLTCSPVQLDVLLQRFWEQEEVTVKTVKSVEDQRCEDLFDATTRRSDDGRYIVELPFRQGGRELGESCKAAVRRLGQMERKFGQSPDLFEQYKSFMAKYLELGHMEEVPAAEVDKQPQCYLPHHAVLKPDSTTTKLRVVFDASAATSNGSSLNSLLLTGPRLQESLTSILMRWRSKKICFSADIEKMYRQILVTCEHQELQRIVWRDSPDEPVRHFRLKTVTYGTSSAPYQAVKTLQRLADDEAHRFPAAASIVRNDFYVDDCLSGADSVDEAIERKDELLKLMLAGGFRLLKWSSNSRQLIESLPADHREGPVPLQLDDEDSTIKALGVFWHPAVDQFGYRVKQLETCKATTKRQMLSEISKLFDPLGLVAPVITLAKTLMQSLWLVGVGWDDDLPEEIVERWRTYQLELPELEQIRISRWCGLESRNSTLQLHGFSDASMSAFAACVYARVQCADGSVKTTLMAAKTSVAPIKQQSIPRLELCGALLLCRLLLEVRSALRCADDVAVYAWTDSTVVLAWINRHANVWQTYVANRVGEIQRSMTAEQWRHVPGVDNPADVASRGIMPSELRQHPLWWHGPQWLKTDPQNWPQQQQTAVDESLLEEKKEKKEAVVSTVVQSSMWDLAHRYSCWRRLLRITALCRRVVRARRQDGRWLRADEVEEARLIWLQLIQSHEFGDVTKLIADEPLMRRIGLRKLNPFVDDRGLLRVGGRLSNANLAYDETHPVILPGRNSVVQLVIKDAHERMFHGGPEATSGQLRQRYWLLNERRTVRAYVHRCVTCVKARPRVRSQLMGTLPEARVRPMRPFLHTAIDYAGPIMSRTARGRGQKAHKSWVAVFTCLSSKATHLELVSELSSVAFMAAFRRFTSRRGLCTDVYSDNGTNFVGADREMRVQLKKAMQDDEWRSLLAECGTKFHFSPPGSPHFNGLAEATVRMAKTAMRKIIGETTLTFEEMCTFLTQVEAALNSRPLSALPSDSGDANVLTPGHFITGQPLTAVPEPSIVDDKVPAGQRWRLVQQMAQHFWRRWSREYLHQLQERKKWQAAEENMTVGDVVVLHDEAKHSTQWRMGRVIDVHPGADGLVRVVSVKTASGVVKRAVAKVSRLPVDNVVG